MTWQNDSQDRFELDLRGQSDFYARDPYREDDMLRGDGEFEDPEEEVDEDDDETDEDDDESDDDDDLEEDEEEEDDL
jgi:hypothetical protein